MPPHNMPLRQALTRSVAEECGYPRIAAVRQIDERYWLLHRKCADRTATPAELDELDDMCAAKEAEAGRMGI